MKKFARDENSSSLARKLAEIKFESVTTYRVLFQEVLDIIAMLGKNVPSDEQLSATCLKAMTKKLRNAPKVLLAKLNAEGDSQTSLEGKTWLDLLDLMEKEEKTKANLAYYAVEQQQEGGASSVSESSDDSDAFGKRKKKQKKQRKKKKKNNAQSTQVAATPGPVVLCYRCGESNHKANQCRHKLSKCRKCQKVGHIERACKGGKLPPRNTNAPVKAPKQSVTFKKNKKKKKKKVVSDSDSSDSESSEDTHLVKVEEKTAVEADLAL